MVEFPKFKGFAAETKLHGIPRMAEGSKTSIIFWTVLVLICIGMAINDLYALVTLYQSAPTAIQMSLVSLPKDYNWTTPTLCMEIYVNFDPNWSGSGNRIPWDSNGDPGEASALFIKGRYIVSQILELLNTTFGTNNYTEVAYQDGTDSPNYIYYSYMMLGYLIEMERQLMGQPGQLENYQFSLAQNDPLIGKHAQYFYDQYSQYNVPMDKLTQIVGMWYCLKQLQLNRIGSDDRFPQIYGHMENYRYFGDPDYISLPMCKANMITHLGFGMVCSKVFETPYVPLKPDFNQFIIYNTLLAQIGANGNGIAMPVMMARLIPNLQFHLDLQGRNVIPADDHTNVFSWNPVEDVVLDISMSAEYKFLSTQKRRCSSSPVAQYDCIWQKRVDFVQHECGCGPSLADIQNPRSGLNCSVDPTNPLLNSIYNISIFQFCPNFLLFKPDLSECIENCHQYTYAFTQQRQKRFPSIFRNWGTMASLPPTCGTFEFRFATDPHVLIAEYVTTDWSNFLGIWGGSIGTWLGASLLAFVHIPVYIVRQYCVPISKSKSAEPD